MKRSLILIAICLWSVSGFTLPAIDVDGGEFYITTDACEPSLKEKKAAEQKEKEGIALLLEGKAGYFFFSSSKMRQVYPNGGIDAQLALSGRLWKWISLYGSVEYIEKKGHSLNDHQYTSIQMVPLSFGVKPTFSLGKALDYYLNVGPRYFILHQHNKSNYVDTKVNESGLGCFVGTGFYIHLNRRLILDTYGEWSYFKRQFTGNDKTNVISRDIDLGGFAFGGGLGYSF
jgi:hypothetical protein